VIVTGVFVPRLTTHLASLANASRCPDQGLVSEFPCGKSLGKSRGKSVSHSTGTDTENAEQPAVRTDTPRSEASQRYGSGVSDLVVTIASPPVLTFEAAMVLARIVRTLRDRRSPASKKGEAA